MPQPKAAYAALATLLQLEWTFLQRVMPDCSVSSTQGYNKCHLKMTYQVVVRYIVLTVFISLKYNVFLVLNKG